MLLNFFVGTNDALTHDDEYYLSQMNYSKYNFRKNFSEKIFMWRLYNVSNDISSDVSEDILKGAFIDDDDDDNKCFVSRKNWSCLIWCVLGLMCVSEREREGGEWERKSITHWDSTFCV